jgi:DNA helicase-2/ATP-dependent DNA helicase PcrA
VDRVADAGGTAQRGVDGRADGPGVGGTDHGDVLASLNAEQRAAVVHGGIDPGPLLVIAGAGSGKTNTLAHRVAHLILEGVDPRRILLLTFSRRAAIEMTRRTERIVGRARAAATHRSGPGRGGGPGAARAVVRWSGTFHAVANRLLRMHADAVGLDPAFTVLDRSDAEDLIDLERNALGLSRRATRFPRKGTCLAIYSHVVNARCTVGEALERAFPWCGDWAEELKALFGAYVEAKQRQHVLDYDDLLLYWHHLMAEPRLAGLVSDRFDHVLVDEYQDTNALQAGILMNLRPSGRGLTVVGDDAQSIYGFRAATVRNILEFPGRFDPPARVIALERSYRSTQPILEAANAVIGEATEGFRKQLRSERRSRQRPVLATVEDEAEQVTYVVERVLAHRENGIPLRRQAVLFRTAHHSDLLEVELARRNVPFVKFGGLKFLEAAHVKDLLAVLRWAENPRDAVAGFRVLQLLPGVGPGHAGRAIERLAAHGYDVGTLGGYRAPAAAAEDWAPLCRLLADLHGGRVAWAGQVGCVRRWYAPHLERLYDAAAVRAADLEQIEQLASAHASREQFLSDLSLDPPDVSGDESGDPLLDEDYLVLSTIHSAKGQEWDVVYVLNAADGCIPSDMSTRSPAEIEEERRLLYVAMTRARDHLHVVHPLRFYVRSQHRHGDRNVLAPRSRFLPDSMLELFERHALARPTVGGRAGADRVRHAGVRVDVGARLRDMWR